MSEEKKEAKVFHVSSLSEKLTPVLLLVIVAMAFGLGILWQKVSGLEKGGSTTGSTTTTQPSTQNPTAQQVTVSLDQVKSLFSKNLIKFGDAKSKVLFVEVSDPSCPYCHIAGGEDPELNKQAGSQFTMVTDGGTYVPPVPEMRKLIDAGKASFVWIYTPGHGNGEMGTKAMYCAYETGKFWQVHDLLMNNKGYDLLNNTVKNDKSQATKLVDFLKGAMDEKTLTDCLTSTKYDQRLKDDIAVATSLGVQGTPGFFVNGTAFNGAYSYTDMKSAVDAALK